MNINNVIMIIENEREVIKMELINKPLIELTRDEADAISDFTDILDNLKELNIDLRYEEIVELIYDIGHQDIGVKADCDEFSFIITD